MKYSTGFWNRMAKSYAKKPVADEEAYQFKLDKIRHTLTPEMKVMEFGCGTGSTALQLAPGVMDYQAVDFSHNMIAIAQQKLIDTPISQLSFKQSALEEFSIDGNSLDVVLGMSVLHLLNDPEAAIQYVFSKLKPGGYFFSSTACIADSMPWFKYITPIGNALRLLPKLHVFTRQTLMTHLSEAGFDIEYQWVSENNKMTCFITARKPIV
jgi:2-polyprenyl-3-methyl-5-hydroxy-6-metoxy-1,4-benzoquinol methylase